MANKSTNTTKKRNWGAVIYPESAPSDWRDILNLKGLAWACSPLHDKDVNPTGEHKKEHYHVIFTFGSPTTYNNVKSILDELNQPIPIPLESVRGYYRYFTHADNPDKYQYNQDDITVYNGFDVNAVLNTTEVFTLIRQIKDFIVSNDITEYSILINMLDDEGFHDMLNVAVTHTIFFTAYLSSRRNKQRDDLRDALKKIR